MSSLTLSSPSGPQARHNHSEGMSVVMGERQVDIVQKWYTNNAFHQGEQREKWQLTPAHIPFLGNGSVTDNIPVPSQETEWEMGVQGA